MAIVQARMGSSRLPGKVLAQIGGRPMLALQLERLQRARSLDHLAVATSEHPRDDAIVALCRSLGVQAVRGPEDDVLARYVLAAAQTRAELVVRLTADCPLIDADVVDAVIAACGSCDYASNVLTRTFPVGLDAEALFCDVLTRVARLAKSAAAREHVTWFIREEARALFVTRNVAAADDHSLSRWTVDTEQDLAHVRRLCERGAGALPYREILALEARA